MKFYFYCDTCGLLDPKRNVCQRSGLEVDPKVDHCSKYIDNSYIYHCDICGKLSPRAVININPDKTKQLICYDCASRLSTCETCYIANTCVFETDPSPTPKAIQKQVRQGNMVQIMTVRNPERIKETCAKSCPCYSEEVGCNRELQMCDKYTPHE